MATINVNGSQAVEFVFDYILVPLAAFAAVDAFLFPGVQMLPGAVGGLTGWIVGGAAAWIAHKWAKSSKLFS